MGSAKIVTLAQQGNEKAIALLIAQSLQAWGIQVAVKRRGNCLYVFLVSTKPPPQSPCLQVLDRGFHRLGIMFPATIEVYGCQHGMQSHVWQHRFQVNVSSQPTPKPNHVPVAPSPPIFKKKAKQIGLIAGMMGLLVGTVWQSGNDPVRFLHGGMETLVTYWRSQIWPEMASRLRYGSNHLAVTLNLQEPPRLATLPSWESLELENQFRRYLDTVNQAQPEITISIKAVGDIIPSQSFGSNRLPPNPSTLLQSVQPLLQDADLVFGNFESTLTNHSIAAKNVASPRVFAFRTPPGYARELQAAGFDVLNIANNHSFDFGEKGFQDTIHYIQKAKMRAVGQKNRSVFVEVKGFTIAWIGFSYFDQHNSIRKLDAAKVSIQKADAHADIVIVSVHAGAEGTGALRVRDRTEYFFGENRGNMVAFSRAAIEAGADLILGHGPHVPRALELYQGRLVAYSLGNFLGYQTLPTKAQLGDSLVLEVKLDPNGEFQAGKILPVRLDARGIPHPDPKSRSVRLIRQLTQQDFPHTPVKIDAQGVIHARK